MLSFRIGKIPVNILPSFLIVTVLFNLRMSSLVDLVAWAGVALASVLVHELGHAAAASAFGLSPRIELHGMGGTTSWTAKRALGVPANVAISLAGPAAGFVVAAVTRWGIGPRWFVGHSGAFVYESLLFANFYWGVLNLIPMLPLDGGSVMTQLLNALTGGRGERPARIVSIVVAATAGGLALFARWFLPAIFAMSFIADNWRGLKAHQAAEHDAPFRPELEKAYAALDAKDAARVVELARPVALQSKTPFVRAEALQLLAFGFLLGGRLADADAAIAAMPKGFAPHGSLLDLRARVVSG